MGKVFRYTRQEVESGRRVWAFYRLTLMVWMFAAIAGQQFQMSLILGGWMVAQDLLLWLDPPEIVEPEPPTKEPKV